MPECTSNKTAEKIKDIIQKCGKFILIATDGAINSKWCNRELGYGDASKSLENVAILPVSNSNEKEYVGNEYLSIYSHIVERKKGDQYNNGKEIIPGYYVRTKLSDTSYKLVPLKDWLNK